MIKKSVKTYYDIANLAHLKRTLLDKKAAVFENLGKFRLIEGRVHFEANIKLRNLIWNHLYHNLKGEEPKTSVANDLLSGKIIILDGFGKVYIWFQEGFYRWHDFHGQEYVPPKPFLRFQIDTDFIEDLLVNPI